MAPREHHLANPILVLRSDSDLENQMKTLLFGGAASVGTSLALDAFHIGVYLPKSSVTGPGGLETDAA
jgi:hypothetical protein